MFNIEDDYIENEYNKEVACASINNCHEESEESNDTTNKSKLILSIFGVLTVGVMGYLGFDHLENSTNLPQETAVMGITHINDSKRGSSGNREELEKELDSIYMNEQRDIREEETINSVVDEFMAQKSSSIKPSGETSKELNSIVDEFYTKKSIPIELDNIVDDFYIQETPLQLERRIITIKQGDTLGSISKRFYGSHKKIQKIIDGNYNLTNDSSTLSIGQKIIVPY